MEERVVAVLQEQAVMIVLLLHVQKDTQQLILGITALHCIGATNPAAMVPTTAVTLVVVILENVTS